MVEDVTMFDKARSLAVLDADSETDETVKFGDEILEGAASEDQRNLETDAFGVVRDIDTGEILFTPFAIDSMERLEWYLEKREVLESEGSKARGSC